MQADTLCVLGAGILLMFGLLTGVWKYLCMHGSEKAEAPYYVNIAHRASLLYAFAALILAELARGSAWNAQLNFAAALVVLIFFVLAIGTYVVHGVLRDTDNQFLRPHRIGTWQLPPWAIGAFMVALTVGEIGGTGILLAGFMAGI